jgi:hypothetical protein
MTVLFPCAAIHVNPRDVFEHVELIRKAAKLDSIEKPHAHRGEARRRSPRLLGAVRLAVVLPLRSAGGSAASGLPRAGADRTQTAGPDDRAVRGGQSSGQSVTPKECMTWR